MLPSFYSWSIEHIKRVFEGKSEQACIQAIDDTFSERLEFTFNGSPLPRVGLQKLVLSMVQSSNFCLNVDWLNAVEVPRDSANRVSAQWACDITALPSPAPPSPRADVRTSLLFSASLPAPPS